MTVNVVYPRSLLNGSVVLVGISYPGDPEDLDITRGRTAPKVFTYAFLKAGGVWYSSGTGKTPQAAGWTAVERWLERDNRKLEFVQVATEFRTVWPEPMDHPPHTDR